MIDAFLSALAESGASGVRAEGREGARAALAEAFLSAGATSADWWEGDPLVASLAPGELAAHAAAADADAGVTGALHGVAATGTLVLTYGEGRSRATGLLPDLHVCVLAADRLVATLPEAIERAYAADSPAALTLVSAPSATSDIEKVRVVGVHGPRALHVVVVT